MPMKPPNVKGGSGFYPSGALEVAPKLPPLTPLDYVLAQSTWHAPPLLAGADPFDGYP
ncbi:MAG: hypothetical protein RL759_564 [Verrucomicrobiota bacterium]|jgi:hypothetical protein|nr:hypothetical protein EMGBS8_14770 [Verrucomicrobiota bacterium]